MLSFFQLMLALAIIITIAKISGYISYRLGQPSVFGELIAGLIMGPTVINLIHIPPFTDPSLEEMIHYFAEFGVLLLMFITGMELHLKDLMKAGKVSTITGILGFLFPVIFGTIVARLFLYDTIPALFIGLILSATSVSISAQTLLELNFLRSRVGISLLGAAVVDDILVVLGVSIFVATMLGGSAAGAAGILAIIVRMLLFLGIGTLLGVWLLSRMCGLINNLPISQGLISFAFVILLAYSWAAEILGNMAAISGALLAGLLFARSPLKKRIEEGISPIAYAIFVPIFFIDIGLSANLRVLSSNTWLLLIAIAVAAILSKIIGAGLGAKFGGFSNREALQMGVGMVARGEVCLIVASVGLEEGLIGTNEFSIAVGLVLITSIITPPLLRSLFKAKEIKRREVLETQ